MTIKLPPADVYILRQALLLAVDYEVSFRDANAAGHTDSSSKRRARLVSTKNIMRFTRLDRTLATIQEKEKQARAQLQTKRLRHDDAGTEAARGGVEPREP